MSGSAAPADFDRGPAALAPAAARSAPAPSPIRPSRAATRNGRGEPVQACGPRQWAAGQADRLPAAARVHIEDPDNAVLFSAANLWEVAIKPVPGRDDFNVDPRLLRRGLLDNAYDELAITGEPVLAVTSLPPIHKDPLDRILVAQSFVEGTFLRAADPLGGPVRQNQGGAISNQKSRSDRPGTN